MSAQPPLVTPTVSRYARRLRFPKLLALTLGLFLFDLFIPDCVPLVDEILLGMLAALFALWKERAAVTNPGSDRPEDTDNKYPRS